MIFGRKFDGRLATTTWIYLMLAPAEVTAQDAGVPPEAPAQVEALDGGDTTSEANLEADAGGVVTPSTPVAPGDQPAEAAALETEPPAPYAGSEPPGLDPGLGTPIEVVARSSSSAADKLRRSAESVKVIETTHARREAADLGEVLARSEGVGVRRAGGLGSGTRFSLNGLTDDQIRFFFDGVPLELSGYAFGISNVPVGLIERVDIYRGVVPVRFGADALGGAVNLASDQELKESRAALSYQTGSFGTHRVSGSGRYVHAPTGAFTRITGFLDRAENDYVVEVDVPDDRGRPRPARVHRSNDGYAAAGGSVEVGVADRPWAKLLAVRAFLADYDKELPHDVVMETPYGRVKYGTRTHGVSLRYHDRFARRLELQLVAGYTQDQRYFRDTSTGIYDWYGRRIGTRYVGMTPTPGELQSGGFDQHTTQHTGYHRSQLAWRFAKHQSLRLAVAPSYSTRSGEDRQIPEGSRDPLEARQKLFTLVTGLEHELDLFDNRVENILFAKDYVYQADAREPRFGGVWGDKDADYHRLGMGDALRIEAADDVFVKASYELATRLPRPDEVFGDGMRVSANLDLQPEVSHNANLGASLTRGVYGWGAVRADVNAFLRDADRLITQLPDFDQQQRFFKYQNVHRARSAGLEAALGWTSPGEYVSVDGNVTWQDFRNLSTEGNAARYEGDRIPNRPWLFANGAVRLQKRAAVVAQDTASFVWYGRYVHRFFRAWESAGALDSKSEVDAQFIQTVAFTYVVTGARMKFGSTLEVDNLTDSKAFDFFGVQRPGRAFYYKATLEL